MFLGRCPPSLNCNKKLGAIKAVLQTLNVKNQNKKISTTIYSTESVFKLCIYVQPLVAHGNHSPFTTHLHPLDMSDFHHGGVNSKLSQIF